MDCPRCGLANTPAAVRCDCGFDLTAPAATIRAVRGRRMRDARLMMLAGAALAAGGLVVSLASWLLADVFGRFWIFHGAAVAGVVVFARGWTRLRNFREAERGD